MFVLFRIGILLISIIVCSECCGEKMGEENASYGEKLREKDNASDEKKKDEGTEGERRLTEIDPRGDPNFEGENDENADTKMQNAVTIADNIMKDALPF